MSISVILTVIVLIVVLIISYVTIKKTKSFMSILANEILEKIQAQQTKIDSLEKKLESYYLSIKLNKLCFIGIGGGGCNIIEDISHIDPWHQFMHVNSDLQALQTKNSKHKILLGYDKKEGLGCGGNKECGELLVNSDTKRELFNFVKDEKSIYIVASLGGGVGSGATPDVIEYLKTLDKEIFVFLTMPFSFEGKQRNLAAKSTLKAIQVLTDNVTVLNNDDLIDENESRNLGTRETFQKTSREIYQKIIADKVGKK